MPKAKGKKGKTPRGLVPQEDFPPKVAVAMAALSVELRRFVFYYCGETRANGTLAAQMVGIGGSYMNRANWASQRLRRADVRAAVNAWMEAFGMTAAEITARVTDIAHVNPGPFTEIDKKGRVQWKKKQDPVEWEAHKHWIKSLKMDADSNVIDVELRDPDAALKELSKINHMYSDAPNYVFNLHLAQMTDTELLRQLEEVYAEEVQPRLAAGPPVRELEPGELLGVVVKPLEKPPPEEPAPVPSPVPPKVPMPVLSQSVPLPLAEPPPPETPPVPMETYIAQDGTTRTRPVRVPRRYK